MVRSAKQLPTSPARLRLVLRRRPPRSLRAIALTVAAALAVACAGLYLVVGGRFLVVDQPRPADAILVLDGGDARVQRAMELLRQGYAPRAILDVSDWTVWGAHTTDLARKFVASAGPDVTKRMRLCIVVADSTRTEARAAAPCLRRLGVHSVLLVTSDFHTRRARLIFRHELPGYDVHVAAFRDPAEYGTQWWTHREWAINFWKENAKFAWFTVAYRWRD